MEDLFETVNFDKILRINEHNLEGEMATCSTYYFQYSMMAAEAEQMEETFKLAKQAYEAEKSHGLKALDPKGVMKEADLHRACFEDEKWQEFYRKELEYHTYVKKLKSMANALDMKSRMLMSMNRRSIFKESQGTAGGSPYKDD